MKRTLPVYFEVPQGKKLGNVLVDDSKLVESWGTEQHEIFHELVPNVTEDFQDAWIHASSDLWDGDNDVTEQQLMKCIA